MIHTTRGQLRELGSAVLMLLPVVLLLSPLTIDLLVRSVALLRGRPVAAAIGGPLGESPLLTAAAVDAILSGEEGRALRWPGYGPLLRGHHRIHERVGEAAWEAWVKPAALTDLVRRIRSEIGWYPSRSALDAWLRRNPEAPREVLERTAERYAWAGEFDREARALVRERGIVPSSLSPEERERHARALREELAGRYPQFSGGEAERYLFRLLEGSGPGSR